MSRFHRRFHDPQYDAQVERALAFVETLGLDGGDPNQITVVPEEKLDAAYRWLGRYDREGQYDSSNGEIFAAVQPDHPNQPGSAALRLDLTLVHEATHKGTIKGSYKRGRAPSFALEAVAGMAEVARVNSLVAIGELAGQPDKVIEFRGREVLPNGQNSFWGHRAVVPAGYFASLPYADGGPKEGPLAAWSLSLAARVSGIEPAEIFAAAEDKSNDPFKLVMASAVALAPDAGQFIRSQDKHGIGLRAGVHHLYEAALARGIVAEPELLRR